MGSTKTLLYSQNKQKAHETRTKSVFSSHEPRKDEAITSEQTNLDYRLKPGERVAANSSKGGHVVPRILSKRVNNRRPRKRKNSETKTTISSSDDQEIFKKLETSDGSVNASEERTLKTKHAKPDPDTRVFA